MIINENIRFLINKFNENKLSHVFLIETNDKEKVLNDLKELVKVFNCVEEFTVNCLKCNLCHLIATDSLPSLEIIYPDGQNIKKTQMEELKHKFSTMPYFSKFNIYIINDAEKFNASSANTMLKFIEEPEANIIGFLITNNKENVINTIKSRCEIIKAYYDSSLGVVNDKLSEIANEYIYKLEIQKKKGILNNKFILDQNLEKDELVALFKLILKFYLSLFQGIEIDNRLVDLKKLKKEELLMRIRLVNEIIERLNYNVNIQLLLDYFVIELEVNS